MKFRLTLAIVLVLLTATGSVLTLGRLAGRTGLDLTEDKLYTLSDGTRTVLARVQEPVTLTLYYSRTAAAKGPEQIRFWNAYYQYVRDLLRAYASVSDGRVTLQVIDPKTYSIDEENATDAGLQRFPLGADDNFYFGLVAQTERGQREALPFFEPNRQALVEYDVTRLIDRVVARDKRRVGILSSLPVNGPAGLSPYMRQMMQMQGRPVPEPWAIVRQLEETYEPVSIDPASLTGGELTEPVDFLVVIHPKDLEEPALFAIDQYVMNGGKLVVLVDPACMQDQPQQQFGMPNAGAVPSSDLNALLEKWGVRSIPNVIANAPSLGVPVPVGQGNRVVRLGTFLDLGPDQMQSDEPVTGDLGVVRLLHAGVLEPTGELGDRVRTLIATGEDASLWEPDSPFALMRPDPESIRQSATPHAGPIPLAALITGPLPSNFPEGITVEPSTEAPAGGPGGFPGMPGGMPGGMGGPLGGFDIPGGGEDDAPPVPATAPANSQNTDDETDPGLELDDVLDQMDAEPDAKHLQAVTNSSEDAAVIVIADVDFITDPFAYQQSFFGLAQIGDNASLLLNALDFLAGSADLIALRSRGSFQRPFEVIDQIEQEAEDDTAEQIEQINADLQRFEAELSELVMGGTDAESLTLIAGEALEKRRQIEEQIREANRELRKLQELRRERVEAVAGQVKLWNLVGAPLVVLVVAIVVAVVRRVRAGQAMAAAGKAGA